MLTFLLSAGLMTLLLLAIVIVPLLRNPSESRLKEASGAEAGLSVFQDQFRELEAEFAQGALTQKEYDESREELERRVLEEAAQDEKKVFNDGKTGVFTALALVLFVPFFATLMWVLTQPLGDFRLDGGRLEAIVDYNQGGQVVSRGGAEMHDMNEAIEKLRRHLQEEPSDLQGWIMYGRTMLTMRQFKQAVEAFDKADQLAPGNPTIMTDLADAIAMTQGQDLSGRPWELVKKTLQIEPSNWKALMMAGSDYFNHGDYRMAVMYWERLLSTLGPDDALASGVKASIQEARNLGGIIGPVPDTLSFGKKTQPAQQEAPVGMMRKGGSLMGQTPVPARKISGVVEIDPAMVDKAQGLDTLYIAARPAVGGRMPVAQTQIKVLQFPVHFTIDESMVPPIDMGAGTLSAHQQVRVTARLGKAGHVMPQAGDIVGETDSPVAIDATDVKLTLKKQR